MIAITTILTGVALLLLGYIVGRYNLSFLVSGYNTTSKKAKEKYDEKKVTVYTGNMLMLSSAPLIVGGLISGYYSNNMQLIIASWIPFTLIIIIGLFYLNTGNRLMKKQ